MNALDRIIKRERKIRYKRLKKLFIARDMASKYLKQEIKISRLDKYFSYGMESHYFIGNLAKVIVDEENYILNIHPTRPKPPPTQTRKR